MKEPTPLHQIQIWAQRQLADYDANRPGTLFGAGIVLDIAPAYALQSAVEKLRQRRGERMIGYKVGCTSPTIRQQLGIDHCITGRLYNSEYHTSGATLSRSQFASLAIEGELAIVLSREPVEQDFSVDANVIPSFVESVFPVIELHNHVMRGKLPSAGELIANNALHAGFVVGSKLDLSDSCVERRFDSVSLSILCYDQEVDSCIGVELTRTINSSLKWLTCALRDQGARLFAGQIVLTGSIPKLISISRDCKIQVNTTPFGSVGAAFIA